jgi:hypothetical protein
LRGNPGIDLLEAADEGLARMPPEFFGDEVFLPLTPRGPGMCLRRTALAATLAIIATRALMETISSDPTFSTSPHSERINRSETSRHSSI